MKDLTSEVSRLQIANNQIQQLIKAREQASIQIDFQEQSVGEAQKMELNDQFGSLNSFVDCIKDTNARTVDIPVLKMHWYRLEEKNLAERDVQIKYIFYLGPHGIS
ncbi:hypothetical protein FNV43_RR21635 [Rhamnella rubrinervis]|uniref:Uncharacterized protein n=1 Tax=Rhamnella rubrinervis TaxID=2594499 RepID=A0A8K0DVI4_9ROSA|nr:hypothetical protein FNV43_RR21635 [Rhamnella rubrinervis]